MTVDLDKIEKWLVSQKKLWTLQNISLQISFSDFESEKKSLSCHLEHNNYLATLTIWNSGEWEILKTDIETEKTEVSPYQPATSEKALISLVNAELIRMKILKD